MVSFVHRFVLKNATGPVSFLELGCGSGPNLRFAPRIGMDCTGIDASEVAVEVCNARLERDGLRADVLHCPFGRLPFPDQSFDCVVDRASLMFADPATRFGAGWVSPEVKRVERTAYVPTLDVTAEWELVLQKV
ncbi:MAG: class I SAM-dependent methyltransferase [Alphaproteobacteria bacterium]|nr:class I SAM-dependent methyltransferase [Alphaproteobacteria bacterium]